MDLAMLFEAYAAVDSEAHLGRRERCNVITEPGGFVHGMKGYRRSNALPSCFWHGGDPIDPCQARVQEQ